MDCRPFTKFRRGLTTAALLSALALAVTAGTLSGEGMVQTGFEHALAGRNAAPSTVVAAAPKAAQSEDFWLRHGSGEQEQASSKPVAWNGHLAAGYRLTVSGEGSQDVRVLEVVETRPVSIEPTRLDLAQSPEVTAVLCRDVGNAAAPLVHFLITKGAFPFNLIKAEKPATS